MTRHLRVAAVIALLCSTVFLAGCPMGGGAQNQQNMPSGMKSPPGLETGGAQTVMGSTTIVAPNEAILLVKFSTTPSPGATVASDRDIGGATPPATPEVPWQSCRRVIPLDSWLLVEGLNFDGRDQKTEKDVNQLIPVVNLLSLNWKYEAKPAPPPSPKKGK